MATGSEAGVSVEPASASIVEICVCIQKFTS